ncbi:MAG: hypothetical protein JW804_08115 [Sedimentisphaerales bacterium]|nr:hypothetical protein [Sedimentisphaerales bacterium]
MKTYLNKLLISVLMAAISLMLILPCLCTAEEPDGEPEPEMCPLNNWTLLDTNEPAPEVNWAFLTGDANEPEPEAY